MQAVFHGAQAILGDEGFSAMERFQERLLGALAAPAAETNATDTADARRAWMATLTSAGARAG